MMATLDVGRRAAAARKNMVITHEPAFHSHLDQTEQLLHDQTYRRTLDLLAGHGMVAFHFRDL